MCIGVVKSPMQLESPPSDHDESGEEDPPTAASDDLDDDALSGIVAGQHWQNFAERDRSSFKGLRSSTAVNFLTCICNFL